MLCIGNGTEGRKQSVTHPLACLKGLELTGNVGICRQEVLNAYGTCAYFIVYGAKCKGTVCYFCKCWP